VKKINYESLIYFHCKISETENEISVKSYMQRVCVCQVWPLCCFVHKIHNSVFVYACVYTSVCVTLGFNIMTKLIN